MLTQRTNFHHSRLPKIGAIVTADTNRPSPFRDPCRRRWIVVAYPLNDNHTPNGGPVYSIGIHTVILRALDNGEQKRVSGHYCEEQ